MAHKTSRASQSGAVRPANRKLVFSTLAVSVALVAIVAAALWWPSFQRGSELDRLTAFRKSGEMTFYGADRQPRRTVDIEVADDDTKRQVGMMYRRELTDRQAMLFVYPNQEVRAFWMQHTKLSLDMLFVDSSGTIVTVYERTTPEDQTRYVSTSPSQYVVEVRAGFAARYGIGVGDSISWTVQPGGPSAPHQ